MRYSLAIVITLLIIFSNLIFPYAYKPDLPLLIYDEGTITDKKTYYTPSFWAGDILSIEYLEKNKHFPKTGKYCIKINYDKSKQSNFKWANISWVFPSYNTGNINGGLNLTGAKKLTFWARGKYGNETAVFKFGGNYGVFSDTADISSWPIKLTKYWKKYTIKLKKHDLSHISLGFSVIITKKDHKKYPNKIVSIFLDRIIIK